MLKKGLSILLALVLMLSLFAVVPVSAEGTKIIYIECSSNINIEGLYLYDTDINDNTYKDYIWSYYCGSETSDSIDLSELELESGKQYYWVCKYRIGEYSWEDYYTYPLLFDTTCFGDTICFTDKTIDWVTPDYYFYDYDYYYGYETRWRSSSLGPMLTINRNGKVVGEAIPNNTTVYDIFAAFLNWTVNIDKSYSLHYYELDQEILDGISVELGLTEDDVEKALDEIPSQESAFIRWYKYYSTISGPVDYSNKNVIYIDTSAIPGYVKGQNQASCYTGNGTYPMIRIDDNTWVFSPDVEDKAVEPEPPQEYIYVNNIKPERTSLTIRLGTQFYDTHDPYPCYMDSTCIGDTLVVENSTVTKDECEYYRVHWRSHDNSLYGMKKEYDNNDYNLVGEAANYKDRIDLLSYYLSYILPEVRRTVIESDQELIDAAAEEIGLKKADVENHFDHNHYYEDYIWSASDSVLPDGYSYDPGSYYLKETDKDVPSGYNVFTKAANSDYYVLCSDNLIISDLYSREYKFIPSKECEVVRYDGGNTFTTVSKAPITVNYGLFYFFRPDNGYCFGFNRYDEVDSNIYYSGEFIDYDFYPEYPLIPPYNISVESSSDGLSVNWEADSKAERFRVFVKEDKDWIAIGDTTDTSMTYTNCVSGNSYSFMVRCVSADGKTYKSALCNGGIGSGHYIATPTITGIRSIAEGNLIKWNPVGGNAKYRVYIKSGKTWKVLGETYDTSFIHSSQGSTSIYAQPGVEYTYTVACISYDGYKILSSYDKTGKSKKYMAMEVGDTDGDGEMASCDATYIQRHVAGMDLPFDINADTADFDGDGDITLVDASLIQRDLAGLKTL